MTVGEVVMRIKGKFVFLFFAFLVLTAFASVSEAKTIYVPDDYEKIQWAVNHASAGDTIIVRDGIYYESIIVSKQLTIKSENGPANCIVNGTGSDVFTLKADGIRIEGFTITGGENGINIRSNNNMIINNNISSNFDGIKLYDSDNNISNNIIRSNNCDGIHLLFSNNNSISENNISSNDNGIFLSFYSNNNSISKNNISNKWNGIYSEYSNNNIIYLNNFINNTYNAFSLNSTNIWNSTEPIKYTYRGSKFKNYMGNYWDDYTGYDDDNEDGIGDTPYSISSDKDYYPLMRPFEYYFVPEVPKVSISTDKYEYTAGDLMLINITFENPKDESKSVKFLWRLDIHDYNLSFTVINNKSLSLPPEFKKTFVISWRLPKWKASFNASWYVALYDGVISEDTADWRYVGKKGGGRDIAIAEYYHGALDFDAVKMHLEDLK